MVARIDSQRDDGLHTTRLGLQEPVEPAEMPPQLRLHVERITGCRIDVIGHDRIQNSSDVSGNRSLHYCTQQCDAAFEGVMKASQFHPGIGTDLPGGGTFHSEVGDHTVGRIDERGTALIG